MSRRGMLKSAMVLGGVLMAGGPGRVAFAQGSDAMIPRLNGGSMGGGTTPQANFNPFTPGAIAGTTGLLFERMYMTNGYNCEFVPWLAEKHEWKDDLTLVFTLRKGVKWNDGTDFTGEDVKFTFDLKMKNAAVDPGGATLHVKSVETDGSTVTFSFKEAAAPSMFDIAEALILPKHVWEKVDDPVTFVNGEQPVGTGPFTLSSFNTEEVVWKKWDGYWAADEIKVQEIGYSKPAEGQANMLRLANGQYDFDAMYIPQVEQVYVAKDKEHNKYWFGQGACISLYLNLTKKPFDDVVFRKAVASAINRDDIAQKAQLGYVSVASQTGLKVPGQDAWIDPSIPDKGVIKHDVDAAKKMLEDAGYTRDGDDLKTPDGTKVEFSFKVPAGWNDWIQAGNIIKDNLKEIGITVNVETPDATIFDKDRAAGNFDSCFGVHGGSCSMYRNFHDHLASEATADIGKAAPSNFVRWKDQETDDLLKQLLTAQKEDEQKAIAFKIEKIMVDKLPTMPLWYGAMWFEYRTEHAVGWPSQDDPYCSSSDFPIMLRHLRAPN